MVTYPLKNEKWAFLLFVLWIVLLPLLDKSVLTLMADDFYILDDQDEQILDDNGEFHELPALSINPEHLTLEVEQFYVRGDYERVIGLLSEHEDVVWESEILLKKYVDSMLNSDEVDWSRVNRYARRLNRLKPDSSFADYALGMHFLNGPSPDLARATAHLSQAMNAQDPYPKASTQYYIALLKRFWQVPVLILFLGIVFIVKKIKAKKRFVDIEIVSEPEPEKISESTFPHKEDRTSEEIIENDFVQSEQLSNGQSSFVADNNEQIALKDDDSSSPSEVVSDDNEVLNKPDFQQQSQKPEIAEKENETLDKSNGLQDIQNNAINKIGGENPEIPIDSEKPEIPIEQSANNNKPEVTEKNQAKIEEQSQIESSQTQDSQELNENELQGDQNSKANIDVDLEPDSAQSNALAKTEISESSLDASNISSSQDEKNDFKDAKNEVFDENASEEQKITYTESDIETVKKISRPAKKSVVERDIESVWNKLCKKALEKKMIVKFSQEDLLDNNSQEAQQELSDNDFSDVSIDLSEDSIMDDDLVAKLKMYAITDSELRDLLSQRNPMHIPFLIEYILSGPEPIRLSLIAREIGHYGDASVIDTLASLLYHNDNRVALAAIQGLANSRNSMAILHLCTFIKSEIPSLAQSSRTALAEFKAADILKAFVELHTHPDEKIRESGVFVLSRMKGKKVEEFLIKMLNDKSSKVVGKVILAMSYQKNPVYIEPLRVFYKTANDSDKSLARKAIVYLQDFVEKS